MCETAGLFTYRWTFWLHRCGVGRTAIPWNPNWHDTKLTSEPYNYMHFEMNYGTNLDFLPDCVKVPQSEVYAGKNCHDYTDGYHRDDDDLRFLGIWEGDINTWSRSDSYSLCWYIFRVGDYTIPPNCTQHTIQEQGNTMTIWTPLKKKGILVA